MILKIQMDKEAIRAFFKTDRGILLISMGISLIFWMLVKLSQQYKANREIAIHYTLPAEMSFVKIPPKKMKVTLDGIGWDLMYDYFSGRNAAIRFNLDNTVLQNITNNQLRGKIAANLTSSNIAIFDMNFDYISIELGKGATKKVPIILEKELTFAPEHQLKSPIQIIPDSVALYGPATFLEEYEAWYTTRLDLQNLKNSVTQSLDLQPTHQEQLQLSTSSVEVTIPVEQFTEKSIFLPVTVKNAPDSLKVFPNKVKISFVIGLSQYDSISKKHFQLEVDLKGIPIDKANNTAPILLTKQPKEVGNVQYSPNSVSFLYIKN